MSVEEMKLKAIDKITEIQNETLLAEVLNYLESVEKKQGKLNLSQHYDSIKEKYGDVLEKLAK
jgi:hypothetical protein